MNTTKNRNRLKMTVGLMLIVSASPLFAATDPVDTAIAVSTPAQAEALEKKVASESEGVREMCIGIAHHNLSGENPKYIATAIDRLEKAWNITGNPIALAYLGSAQTMRGGLASNEGDVIAAITDLDGGLKKIDQAVELDPDDTTLRFLRIQNGIDISAKSPINRVNEIEIDLKKLGSTLESLDSENAALYWLSKGQFEMIQGLWDNAYDSLGKAIAAAPDSAPAQKAEDLLWELEE